MIPLSISICFIFPRRCRGAMPNAMVAPVAWGLATTHNSLTLRRCFLCFFANFRRLFKILFAVMLLLSISICSYFSVFFASAQDSGQLCRECSIFRTTLSRMVVSESRCHKVGTRGVHCSNKQRIWRHWQPWILRLTRQFNASETKDHKVGTGDACFPKKFFKVESSREGLCSSQMWHGMWIKLYDINNTIDAHVLARAQNEDWGWHYQPSYAKYQMSRTAGCSAEAPSPSSDWNT